MNRAKNDLSGNWKKKKIKNQGNETKNQEMEDLEPLL